MKNKFRIVNLLLTFVMIISLSTQNNILINDLDVFATETKSETTKTTETAKSDKTNKPNENAEKTDEKFVPNFTFPDELRSVTITPGYDFYKTKGQSATKTKSEIQNIINDVNSFQLNSIVIDTNYNNKAYYTSDVIPTEEETALKMLIEEAKKNYLFVYVNFDINFVLNEFPKDNLQEKINYLTSIAYKFSREYMVDGVILEGYYANKDISNYGTYINNGSGIGFENYLLENGAYIFSLVSDSIHKSDNTIPVGITISNAWANSSSNKKGSNTHDNFEALNDGYADTISYLKENYADFIMLKTTGSLTDSKMPFSTVTKWWSNQAKENDIPLFISHANEKIGTSAQGWSFSDQIVKQLLDVKKMPKYSGSTFNSLQQLRNNTSSTNAMIKFYQNQIDKNSLLNELEINSPTKTTYTTYEPNVKFQGSFDSNFDVTFNDKPIKLNKAGYFYYELPLEVGLNTFKIENKGKVIIYRITRKIKVLKSVTPTAALKIDGKTKVSVSAIAYKGSVVRAKFNGSTITLKENTASDNIDINSSYAEFTGSFNTPKGVIGSEKKLGSIAFYASYKGANHESRTGASVRLNALPEKPKPEVVLPDVSKGTQGNPTIPQPQTPPEPESGKTSLLKITTDCAKIYDATNTYKYPVPRSRLPVGTYDIFKSTSGYYYTTLSGRRIPKSYAQKIDNQNPILNNEILFKQASVVNYDTILKFKLNTPVPIDVSYSPCKYYKGRFGDYKVDFNSNQIILTFDYVTKHDYNVNLPSASIFSSAKWSYTKVNDNYYRQHLTLTLKKSGAYSGVSYNYTNDGTLTVRFNGHPKTLKGAVIVVDPGHGLVGNNKNDPGAQGHVIERDINLQVAKIVESKLKNLGATIHRLKTENTNYITQYRADYARKYKPDMYISIHCNAAGSSAKGSEAFYFYPFSQPLAKYMANNLSTALETTNRGNFYNEYWVTLQEEFPSTLIELGFVTNENEAMKLADETYQNKIADSIIESIKQYLSNN